MARWMGQQAAERLGAAGGMRVKLAPMRVGWTIVSVWAMPCSVLSVEDHLGFRGRGWPLWRRAGEGPPEAQARAPLIASTALRFN